MSEEEKCREEKVVQMALDQLMQHFDTVHIFVTRVADGQSTTSHISQGAGNWFARYGQIRGWVLRADQSERIEGQEDLTGLL